MTELREYAVVLEPVDDENWRMSWDGQSEIVETWRFFATDVLDEMLVNSLRIMCAIENKPNPTAASLLTLIRSRGGFQTPSRAVYVAEITQDEDGVFRLWYDYRGGDPSYSIPVTPDDLARIPTGQEQARLLAYNIGAFLRFRGLSSLSPEALQAIQSRKFRGF
jgi:hypothetical protein